MNACARPAVRRTASAPETLQIPAPARPATTPPPSPTRGLLIRDALGKSRESLGRGKGCHPDATRAGNSPMTR